MHSPVRRNSPDNGRGLVTDSRATVEGFEEEALVHLTAIRQFSLRLCSGEVDEAEDVTQETYLRALRGWTGYERGTNCRAWLFTICRRVFLRRMSRYKRERFDCVDVGLPPVTTSTWTRSSAHGRQAAQSRFESDQLLNALDRLPGTFRSAAKLRFVTGLSYAEIARELDIPVGTVKSRVHRGRLLLRQWRCAEPSVPADGTGPAGGHGSNGGGCPSEIRREEARRRVP